MVLEKSRGLGGRAATRRWNGRPVDHGAQFFTARSSRFIGQVEEWSAKAVCFAWAQGFHQHSQGRLQPPGGNPHARYACRQGMSALGRDLADGLEERVLREAKVETITHAHGLWHMSTADNRVFTSPAIIMTAPSDQASALLHDAAPAAAEAARSLAMAPCFALAASFRRFPVPWQGIQLDSHPVLTWIGNDTSKRPDAHPGASILMLHASPEYTSKRFDANPAEITAAMLEAASAVTGDDLRSPEETFLHRWRYAQPATTSNPRRCEFFESPGPLAIAGDSLAGGKIEGAWLSGQAASVVVADYLRGGLNPRPPIT
jgi:renalase